MIIHGLGAAAVIFDCDGVLVDSEPLSFEAWSATLRRHGYELSAEAFAVSVGGTETMVAEEFAPHVKVDPARLEHEARVAFARLAPRVQAFQDTMELIMRVEAEGLPIAVATNGLRWRLDVLLGAVGLERLIPTSVTSDEVEHPKPAADLYLAAAGLAGVEPSLCLVIEDSPTGIASAVAAGCRVVAVDRGMFGPDRLALAEVVVPSL